MKHFVSKKSKRSTTKQQHIKHLRLLSFILKSIFLLLHLIEFFVIIVNDALVFLNLIRNILLENKHETLRPFYVRLSRSSSVCLHTFAILMPATTCASTCLNLFIEVGGFRLIIGQVGLESFDLLFLVTHGFVERLELLADPPVSLLLRRELVAASLLGVQLLAPLLGQR